MLPAAYPADQTCSINPPAYQQPAARAPSHPTPSNPDHMASLYTQLNDLNLGSKDAPRDLPPIKAVGDISPTTLFCPEDRLTTYELYWYHLPDIPEYLICAKCYVDFIEGSPLAGQFCRIKRTGGSTSSCRFFYPRLKNILWPQALRNNNLNEVRTFMQKRLGIPSCKGHGVAVTAAEGVKWYALRNKDIEDFIVCEACYEDFVRGSSFESRYAPSPPQPAENLWMCDMCVPYIGRAAIEYGKNNDWQTFVANSARRMQLPACDGGEIDSSSAQWFVLAREIEGFRACETCYLDKVALNRFDREFKRYTSPSGFGTFLKQVAQDSSCKLTDSNVPMAFALDMADCTRNFSLFWNAAQQISALPPCTANGVQSDLWAGLLDCDELSVCEACRIGILDTTGVAQYFVRVQRDPSAAIVCGFCVGHPRFGQFFPKFIETLDRGVFSHYAEYVKRLAGAKPCPKIGVREQGKWWGYRDALFCEECYWTFVSETSLGKNGFPIQNLYDSRAQICQIWSPRMRNMWLKACSAGAPGSEESRNAVNEFQAFGAQRQQIYMQTVQQIEFIEKMKLIKMQQAIHQGGLSLQYKAMNSRAELAGTTDGYWHGNSSLGWYATENGATGAQMYNNMQAGMRDALNGDDTMKTIQLQMAWSQVE